ncbi:MAG: hypothetical protein WC781_02490 [Candidatus Pacearchaeota archaeon]|jgi:hypothetical protein
MNKWVEILLGLILVLGAVFLVFGNMTPTWAQATWVVLKGGIVWGVFFVGLLFLMLGISDLKG